MANDYDYSQEDKKSKYNAAIAQLYRLDELLKNAHKNRRISNFQAWNLDLDAVWLELSEDAKKEDIEKFLEFNEKLIKEEFFIPFIQEGFATISPAYTKKLGIYYQILLSKEMWLRKLMNSQGKSATYEDPSIAYMQG